MWAVFRGEKVLDQRWYHVNTGKQIFAGVRKEGTADQERVNKACTSLFINWDKLSAKG